MSIVFRNAFGLAVLAVSGCVGTDGGSVGVESAPLVSQERTFLVPVDDRARVACRDEVNTAYCARDEAQAAIGRCLAKIGAHGLIDACASGGERCLRLETYNEPCAATGPVYPDAQSCLTPRRDNCSFYSACVEPSTHCGEDGYALGYGERYCTAFKSLNRLSPQGMAWKSAVMLCLQDALVPFVEGAATTCSDLLDTAFASHPHCYTQPDHSFCFLPPSDTLQVLKTIGINELLASRTRQQIAETAEICVGQIAQAISHVASGASPRAHVAVASRVTSAQPEQDLDEQRQFWEGIAQQYAQ
jgi:hypothetical protein